MSYPLKTLALATLLAPAVVWSQNDRSPAPCTSGTCSYEGGDGVIFYYYSMFHCEQYGTNTTNLFLLTLFRRMAGGRQQSETWPRPQSGCSWVVVQIGPKVRVRRLTRPQLLISAAALNIGSRRIRMACTGSQITPHAAFIRR
jgi:hypothetical protein